MKKITKTFLCIFFCSFFIVNGSVNSFAYDNSVILFVQSYLNFKGYDCGPTDGILGDKTSAAIKRYQSDHNLAENGQISEELLADMGYPFAANSNEEKSDTLSYEQESEKITGNLEDALCEAALDYYQKHSSGYRPSKADCEIRSDSKYAIHLYDIVDNHDGTYHTATSAWYEVDSNGTGKDIIFGDPVQLVLPNTTEESNITNLNIDPVLEKKAEEAAEYMHLNNVETWTSLYDAAVGGKTWYLDDRKETYLTCYDSEGKEKGNFAFKIADPGYSFFGVEIGTDINNALSLVSQHGFFLHNSEYNSSKNGDQYMCMNENYSYISLVCNGNIVREYSYSYQQH